jgi:ParB-like chromosome segregation protein Spo0J
VDQKTTEQKGKGMSDIQQENHRPKQEPINGRTQEEVVDNMCSSIDKSVHIGGTTFRMDFEGVVFPLEPDQRALLEEGIKRIGVKVPVIMDQFDRVIDGHNRIRIAEKHGITAIPIERVEVKDDDAARRLAIELNLQRRQLSTKQRALLAELLLKMDPERSDREIGRAAGISGNTVGRIRGELESGAQIEHLEKTKGKDGKTYTAKRKPRPAFQKEKQRHSQDERIESWKQQPDETAELWRERLLKVSEKEKKGRKGDFDAIQSQAISASRRERELRRKHERFDISTESDWFYESVVKRRKDWPEQHQSDFIKMARNQLDKLEREDEAAKGVQ